MTIRSWMEMMMMVMVTTTTLQQQPLISIQYVMQSTTKEKNEQSTKGNNLPTDTETDT